LCALCRRELWQFWRRVPSRIALVVAAVLLVLWTHWMVQRYLILGDDTARGERFRQSLHPTGRPAERERFVYDRCQTAAEAFYDHGIAGSADGPAPPEERRSSTPARGQSSAVGGGSGSGGE
jgi:hypothetical protein